MSTTVFFNEAIAETDRDEKIINVNRARLVLSGLRHAPAIMLSQSQHGEAIAALLDEFDRMQAAERERCLSASRKVKP